MASRNRLQICRYKQNEIEWILCQRLLFQVPLFLTVFCCVENEKETPNLVMGEDLEIFDLFQKYTQMLLRRHKKRNPEFCDNDAKQFVKEFGKIIEDESSDILKLWM